MRQTFAAANQIFEEGIGMLSRSHSLIGHFPFGFDPSSQVVDAFEHV
jgi:hypothetical protein